MSAPVGARPEGSVSPRDPWAEAAVGPAATATTSRMGRRTGRFIARPPLRLLALGRRTERFDAHGRLDAVLEMGLELGRAGEGRVLPARTRVVSERGDPGPADAAVLAPGDG